MRKVIVCEYQGEEKRGQFFWKKVFLGEGVFHQFGLDCKAVENGGGSYSIAIVEMPDGTVRSVPVENTQFKDTDE